MTKIYIMCPLMGETEDEEEICQGWTFTPLFDKWGKSITTG